jgi:hypothetical protein
LTERSFETPLGAEPRPLSDESGYCAVCEVVDNGTGNEVEY